MEKDKIKIGTLEITEKEFEEFGEWYKKILIPDAYEPAMLYCLKEFILKKAIKPIEPEREGINVRIEWEKDKCECNE